MNIFNLQRQPAIFDECDGVNWLNVYTCDDSCTDSLIDNDFCDKINSFAPDSSDPHSFANTSNPALELKPLPDSLKYVFFGHNETFSIIIASDLIEDQEHKLLKLHREHKEAIGRILGDIKGISPSIVQHRIHLEENAR